MSEQERMKSPNDPTSQSEDETKFYQKIEGDLEAEEISGLRAQSAVLESENETLREDSVKAKRIAYAIAQVERLRRELEAAKHNLRVEQGYSQ
jgi:hypothetical protein